MKEICKNYLEFENEIHYVTLSKTGKYWTLSICDKTKPNEEYVVFIDHYTRKNDAIKKLKSFNF